MNKILIAEDEEAIREFVVINLRHAGYTVVEAANGEEAIDKFFISQDYDVVILDIMMPLVDGVEVCRRIRDVNTTVGIIMLTAKSQDTDKVGALLGGADDYVTKPFSPTELVARVSTLCRRVHMLSNAGAKGIDRRDHGDFSLNMHSRTLSKGDKEFDLTPVEFQLLEILFEAEGETVERTDIMRRIWGESFLGEDKIVDVNIRRLRMKVEDDPSEPRHIITVRGIGYRWKN
ncbi:MAG: response regulator transcription factor [Acutalibacteraceae bacterium]